MLSVGKQCELLNKLLNSVSTDGAVEVGDEGFFSSTSKLEERILHLVLSLFRFIIHRMLQNSFLPDHI